MVKQIEYEADKNTGMKQNFDEYAKEWWNDFQQIRGTLKKRVVPICVETDDRDT